MAAGRNRTLRYLAGASAIPLALLAVRVCATPNRDCDFLAWNLFLAWIPLLLALALTTLYERRRALAAGTVLIAWVLFLPNAPYVVTDFVHLRDLSGMPRPFDAVLIASFAGASLLLGFASLHLVHSRTLRPLLGGAWSWAATVAVICLCGFGIYLGRFKQVNSWDVLQPHRLLAAVVSDDPTLGGRRVVALVFMTVMLVVLYVVGERVAGRTSTVVSRSE